MLLSMHILYYVCFISFFILNAVFIFFLHVSKSTVKFWHKIFLYWSFPLITGPTEHGTKKVLPLKFDTLGLALF